MKSADYTQGDAFQAEKRTIFSREWLPLCAEGQLATPGAFVSASIGGWGVVAVRDQASTVRVLRNACRHQNMPVVNAGAGTCETFRCRFHGWTYGLDGKFVSAPPPMAPPPTQTDRDLLALPARCQGGILFFSMGPAGEGPGFARDLPAYSRTSVIDIDCNWKVCVEHLLEHGGDFHWPLLFVEGAVVRQIVPHTFLRTRLFTHAFGQEEINTDPIKQACEQLQADRVAGTMPAAGSDFHRRLGEAYSGSS